MLHRDRAELVRADQVIATVTPVDEARSVVRFDVELSGLRRSQRNLAIGLGVVANAAAFATVSVVEQMLDELEGGGMQETPTLLQQVRGALLGGK